ncbi:hypothetical protein [Nostoc sp. FACHB-280]|uniref:hypothetical protein n=1 Tax=Nostoc sp. FACHB-280 TaxID=2692839 RepID=UPI00168A92BA|nr:hypothetical protein [Nostoc sp. FACHB-280]MBD2498644.1 hypothetical protein [Nostoc sp. FACHB-280]
MAQKTNQGNDSNREPIVTVNFGLSKTLVSFFLGVGLTYSGGTMLINKQSQNQYVSCPIQWSFPLNQLNQQQASK